MERRPKAAKGRKRAGGAVAAQHRNNNSTPTKSGSSGDAGGATLNLLETSEFRSQPDVFQGDLMPTGNNFNSAVSYATLTPLQPLPPISTVKPSDTSFVTASVVHDVNNTNGSCYTFELQNISANNSSGYCMVDSMQNFGNVKFDYDFKPANGDRSSSSPTPGTTQFSLPQTINLGLLNGNGQFGQNSLLTGYGCAVTTEGIRSPKLESVGNNNYSVANGYDLPNYTSQSSAELYEAADSSHNNSTTVTTNDTNGNGVPQKEDPVGTSTPVHLVVTNNNNSVVNDTGTGGNAGGGGGQRANRKSSSVSSPTNSEMEQINTKEIAQRISAELKRYSIPQAIFAQRVLCRSQGTLSDLLRNPKPWAKLKSGRETFKRMYKWLQEPEFQRMSTLRLAGKPLIFLILAESQGTLLETQIFFLFP